MADTDSFVTEVTQLDPAERDAIVAARTAGASLDDLQHDHPAVAPFVIREVLEASGTQAPASLKQGPEPSNTSSTGGPTTNTPPPTEPRYVEPFAGLADRVVAARIAVGSRSKLADLLATTGSAVWRHEHNRTHPAELADLLELLAAVEDRIEAGDFAKATSDPAATKLSTALNAITEVLSILDEVNELNKNQKLVPFLVKAASILADIK